MKPAARVLVLAGILLPTLLLTNGCVYLQNRGHDAADMFEVGITVSSKAQLAIYPAAYFNLVSLGYSNVEGTYYGIGGRTIGSMPFKDKASWGVVLWGYDNLNVGPFNPDDPHQAWRSDMAKVKAQGNPLPGDRPEYSYGAITLAVEGHSAPPITYFQCRRNVHLGWIGIHASLRPLDIVDFILGWTTLDILGDDQPAPAPAAPSSPPAPN